jgi:hypothetical protein
MNRYKKQLLERWVEFNKHIAGDIEDPSFHSGKKSDSIENVDKMVSKLNQIFMNRKLGKTKKSKNEKSN